MSDVDNEMPQQNIAHLAVPGDPKGMGMVVDDHQFLDWQPTRMDCEQWRRWFVRRDIAHVVADGPLGWTIFKHLWRGGKDGSFCCGADG